MGIEIAPRVVEWEYRYIYHFIQSGCRLLNYETMDESLVARIRMTSLDFLTASFEELAAQQFFSARSLEAFVRAWYC